MIELHTNTVTQSTLQLLQKLQVIPMFNNFRLVGGTALALQIGHRNSVDLDLFGQMQFTREELEYELRKNNLETVIRSYNEVVRTAVIENVKVDFVDYSMIKWLEPQIETNGIRLAELKDIGALLAEAQKRTLLICFFFCNTLI